MKTFICSFFIALNFNKGLMSKMRNLARSIQFYMVWLTGGRSERHVGRRILCNRIQDLECILVKKTTLRANL